MKTRCADAPGCPRCRMDAIRFLQDVALPRFSMLAGETWNLLQCRYKANGDAELGCGLAPAHTFEIIQKDARRSLQCCKLPSRDSGYWQTSEAA